MTKIVVLRRQLTGGGTEPTAGVGKWGRLVNILGKEGEYRRTADIFYVAMVQSVLLFGSETWVMTPQLDKAFEGFHHQALQNIAFMGPKCQWDGT